MTPKQLERIRDEELELGQGRYCANTELAALLGVSRQAVQRYMAGERKITRQTQTELEHIMRLKELSSGYLWREILETVVGRR
jgi:predicted transcriptional regulator